MWIALNFHPAQEGGGIYLIARDSDSEANDGELRLVNVEQLLEYQLVDFVEDSES